MQQIDYDAVVAGAGPAGAAMARELAAQGCRVLLLEAHPQVGIPCHCSGLVTPRTLALAGVDGRFTRNAVTGAVIHAPGGRQLQIGGTRVQALVIDRPAFDRALAEQAQAAGAELTLASMLVGWDRDGGALALDIRRKHREYRVRTRLLIGADGAQSRVARRLAPPVLHEERLVGLGAELQLSALPLTSVQVFLGNSIAPGFFAWLIPVAAGYGRLGIATSGGRPPAHYLQRLLDRYPQIFAGCTLMRFTGGVISMRRLAHITTDNVMLVGDAAGHVKPTSGGGIYTALLGASHAARVALKALRQDDLSAVQLAPYEQAWQAAMGRELDCGRSLRAVVQQLNDTEIDRLIGLLSSPVARALISRYGDIDFPSRLALKLLSQRRLGGIITSVLHTRWSFDFGSDAQMASESDHPGSPYATRTV